MEDRVTISLERKTRGRLEKRKANHRETYDMLINRLLGGD